MNLKSLFRNTWNTNSNFHIAQVKINSLHQIFRVIEYLYKTKKKSQIWPGNTKSFFSENEAIVETSQKCSSHNGVTYKHVHEYCYKAWKYQICSINTQPFSWKSEKISDSYQTFYSYIRITYKYVFESLKDLNQISWAIELS